MEQLHCLICGRVQHVGFRRFVVRHALSLGVSGFVRNRFDGSVEVYAVALPEVLSKFLGCCNKGPIFASVTDVQFLPADDALFRLIDKNEFKVLPTE
jgi:acylphosphatase